MRISCCQGGIRDGETCLGCALHGEPNICEHPLAIIKEMVHGQARRGQTGDYSATRLQNCPRFVQLTSGESGGSIDSPDRYYARARGSIVHRGAEETVKGTPGTSTEARLFKDIEVDGEVFTISGQYDLRLHSYRGGTILEDYKTTGKSRASISEPDKDYGYQANNYAWLHEGGRVGIDGEPINVSISAYRVWYFASDGTKGFWVPIREVSETEAYIRERIRAFNSDELNPILPFREFRNRKGEPQFTIDKHCGWCPIKDQCFAMEGMKVVGTKAKPLDYEEEAREAVDDPFSEW